jgi:PAS domain S-box-containing protein
MKTHDAQLLQIKELLRENPKGIKITRIARELAMNRNAAAKFLEILLMTGQVEMLEHGMSKIFILSRSIRIPTMLDRSSDFIVVLDQEMKISQVNDNYLKFAGTKREDILGKRAETTGLPVIGRQPFSDKIRQAHYGSDLRFDEKEILGGRECIFDIRMTPTVFNNGTRGITIIIGDVTHEKEKEISLRRMVEEILSCIDDAVILVDFGTGKISFANPAAGQMFGCTPSEYVGKDPGLVLSVAGTIPGYSGDMQDTFKKQGYCETQSLMKRDGGEEFPVTLHLRPIYGDCGGLRNIVMVIRDMTQRKWDGDSQQSTVWNPQIPLSLRIGRGDSDRHCFSV